MGMEKLLVVCFVVLSMCAKQGSTATTSSYIRSQFPATDIPLASPIFEAPKGYNAPQQVHITQGDYDGKAVIISWVTPSEAGESIVRYGTSEKVYDRSAEGKVQTYTFYYNYKSGHIHQVLVDGLEYDTKYYYKIGEGATAREFWFRTPPKIDPDTPYTFGIMGDLGQTYNSLSTIEHYMASEGQTVLFVGGLSYADEYVGTNEMGMRWDTWGRLVEQSTAYQPWIWTPGDHEIELEIPLEEFTSFKAYLIRYESPYSASDSTNPLYYAIRRASAHIIVISSYSPFVLYSPQWEWLKKELEAVDREKTPWLIVLMHVPFYSSNKAHYMQGEAMRVVFESWFVQYKVDLVFSGHVPAYERSYRYSNIQYKVTNGLCNPIPDESAPVYITIGDGGNKEGLASNFSEQQPDYSAFREASYGHATLEIKNRTHAFFQWNRNDDGKNVPADSAVFLNRYWASDQLKRELKKNYLKSVVVDGTETY